MTIDNTVGQMWKNLRSANEFLKDFTAHFAMTPNNPSVGVYLLLAETDLFIAEGMHKLVQAGSPRYDGYAGSILRSEREDLETYYDNYYNWDPLLPKGFEKKDDETSKNPEMTLH